MMARQAKTVTITINGTPLQVEEGTLLVEAASRADVEIPTICYGEVSLATGYLRHGRGEGQWPRDAHHVL